MTKTEKCLTALETIGHAARNVEISSLAGVNANTVSALLSQQSKRHGKIGMAYTGGLGGAGGKVAYYFFQDWPKTLKKIPLKDSCRQLNDPEEADWHCRKISEYGLKAWAEIVNRDPMDLLLKLRRDYNANLKHCG